MAGIDFVFNRMLGRVGARAELTGAADAFILVPIENTGLEADSTLRDYDDLDALLTAANNEQTTMGRKTISSASIIVDDTGNTLEVDLADQTYVGATGNAVGKVLFCYDGDTGAGTDANVEPCTAHNVTITPSGNDITIQVHADGIFQAQG